MMPLVTYVNYDRWANLGLLRAVSNLDPPAFSRLVGGSFPSVHQTFVHLLWAESLWLERWRGGSFPATLDPQAFPTPESLRAALEAVHDEQLRFLTGIPPSAADQVITYVNFQGQTWAYPLRDMVQHLIVHSAFHRGQVAFLLRHLGSVPPHTDYLVYIDALSEMSPTMGSTGRPQTAAGPVGERPGTGPDRPTR
jgi:uncharacterized damage-inducible protein DinB